MIESARNRLRLVYEATVYEESGLAPLEAVRLACSRHNLLDPDEVQTVLLWYDQCCEIFDSPGVPEVIDEDDTKPIREGG